MYFSSWVIATLFSCAVFAAETSNREIAPPPLMVRPIPTAPAMKAPAGTPASKNSLYSNDDALSMSPPQNLASRVPAKRTRTWVMSFGPGLTYFDGADAKQTNSGRIGFSSHFGAVTQLTSDSPLFIGADIGLQFWSFDDSRGERSATGFQILPTAYYNFDWNFQSSFQPYLGVAMGPHIYFSRVPGQNSTTAVNFEALLRPGIIFLMAPGLSINFEPKIGFIGTDLIFLPQLAANLFL